MTQLVLHLDRVPSPIGTLLILTDLAGRVRSVDFSEDDLPRSLQQLRRHAGVDVDLDESGKPSQAARQMGAYLAGDLAALDGMAVESAGTEFQQKVWAALRTIPVGKTASYGEIAARIGQPKASRAVGMANNANPIPIIVPCHRVIGADGSMTGYGGGLDRKRWLLAHEGLCP
jgi:methylated-DNA-[protein]-cysteine S-methyltransferase